MASLLDDDDDATEEVEPKADKNGHVWQNEWKGMPEFVQEKQKPFSTIIIRCETEEDLNELAQLLGQPLTSKTKSIWHPRLKRGQFSHLGYLDETD
jgi:hypothetical protein